VLFLSISIHLLFLSSWLFGSFTPPVVIFVSILRYVIYLPYLGWIASGASGSESSGVGILFLLLALKSPLVIFRKGTGFWTYIFLRLLGTVFLACCCFFDAFLGRGLSNSSLFFIAFCTPSFIMTLQMIKKSLQCSCNRINVIWLHVTVEKVSRDRDFIVIHKTGKLQVPEDKTQSQ